MITERMLVILVDYSCIYMLNIVKFFSYITLISDILKKEKGVYDEKELKNNTDLSISFS